MMQQYRELEAALPGLSAAVPPRRLLRAVLRGRPRRRPACCRSRSPRSRATIPMAGHPASRRRHATSRGSSARARRWRCASRWRRPAKGKKLVRREVVRVVTPGTLTDTQYPGRRRQQLPPGARTARRAPLGVALVDVSTGEFWVGEEDGAGDALLEAALLRRPAELLVGARAATGDGAAAADARGASRSRRASPGGSRRGRPENASSPTSAATALDGLRRGRRCRRACRPRAPRSRISRETQGESLGAPHADPAARPGDAMLLDQTAVATLELFETAARSGEPRLARRRARRDAHAHGRARSCASGCCARCSTARRSAATGCDAAPVDAPDPARATACARASRGRRLERLASRAALGVAHARDLVALRGFLARAARAAGGRSAPLGAAPRARCAQDIAAPPALTRLLDEALEDEPPPTLREGGLIREGWSAELARAARAGAARRKDVDRLARGARARSGPGSAALRVRFNRVFGYAIEVQQRARRPRCPPTTSGARRWSAPSATSPRS